MRNLLMIGALGLALTLASPGARADDENASYFLLGTLVGSQLHHHGTRRAPVNGYNAGIYRYQPARHRAAECRHLRPHAARRGHYEYRYHHGYRASQHRRTHRDHGWSQRRDHQRTEHNRRADHDQRYDHNDRGYRARPPKH